MTKALLHAYVADTLISLSDFTQVANCLRLETGSGRGNIYAITFYRSAIDGKEWRVRCKG